MKRKVNALKWYNIFSWLYLRYFKNKNVSLDAVFIHFINCADKDGHGSSYWDVFDVVCWICFSVFCWMVILLILVIVFGAM